MKTTKIGSQQIKMNSHYLICTFMICDSCSDVEKYTQYNLVLVLLFSPLLKLIKLWFLNVFQFLPQSNLTRAFILCPGNWINVESYNWNSFSKYFKILKLPHWQRLQCGEYYICNNFNCTSISFGKIYNDGKQKISWWWWKVNKKSIKIAFREHNILGVFFNHKINRFVPTYNKENVKIFISLANIVCTCVNSVLISCPLNSSLTISWPILYRSVSSFWKVKFLTLHTLGIYTIPQSVNFILVW